MQNVIIIWLLLAFSFPLSGPKARAQEDPNQDREFTEEEARELRENGISVREAWLIRKYYPQDFLDFSLLVATLKNHTGMAAEKRLSLASKLKSSLKGEMSFSQGLSLADFLIGRHIAWEDYSTIATSWGGSLSQQEITAILEDLKRNQISINDALIWRKSWEGPPDLPEILRLHSGLSSSHIAVRDAMEVKEAFDLGKNLKAAVEIIAGLRKERILTSHFLRVKSQLNGKTGLGDLMKMFRLGGGVKTLHRVRTIFPGLTGAQYLRFLKTAEFSDNLEPLKKFWPDLTLDQIFQILDSGGNLFDIYRLKSRFKNLSLPDILKFYQLKGRAHEALLAGVSREDLQFPEVLSLLEKGELGSKKGSGTSAAHQDLCLEDPSLIGQIEALPLIQGFAKNLVPDLSQRPQRLYFEVYRLLKFGDPAINMRPDILKNLAKIQKEFPGLTKFPFRPVELTPLKAQLAAGELAQLLDPFLEKLEATKKKFLGEIIGPQGKPSLKAELGEEAFQFLFPTATIAELKKKKKHPQALAIIYGGLFQKAQNAGLDHPVLEDLPYLAAMLSLGANDIKADPANFLSKLSQNPPDELTEIISLVERKANFVPSHPVRLVRPLSLIEAPYRSCLGGDCSTFTYMEKALQENYHYFTLTSANGHSQGHVTLVVGRALDPTNMLEPVKVAYVDKIQGVSLEMLAPTLEAIRRSLKEEGYTLSLPRDLGDENGISNVQAVRDFIREKLPAYKNQIRVWRNFQPEQVQPQFATGFSKADFFPDVLPLLPLESPYFSFHLKEPLAPWSVKEMDEGKLLPLLESLKNGNSSDKLAYLYAMENLDKFHLFNGGPEFGQTLIDWLAQESSSQLRMGIINYYMRNYQLEELRKGWAFLALQEKKELLNQWIQSEHYEDTLEELR